MSDNLREVVKLLLELGPVELREVYEELCDRLGTRERRAESFIDIMSAIVGTDIRVRSRRHKVAWGRFIVISELLERGWNLTMAAEVFGMDHSSVIYARDQVDNMLVRPKMYQAEMRMYREFKKRINNG